MIGLSPLKEEIMIVILVLGLMIASIVRSANEYYNGNKLMVALILVLLFAAIFIPACLSK